MDAHIQKEDLIQFAILEHLCWTTATLLLPPVTVILSILGSSFTTWISLSELWSKWWDIYTDMYLHILLVLVLCSCFLFKICAITIGYPSRRVNTDTIHCWLLRWSLKVSVTVLVDTWPQNDTLISLPEGILMACEDCVKGLLGH